MHNMRAYSQSDTQTVLNCVLSNRLAYFNDSTGHMFHNVVRLVLLLLLPVRYFMVFAAANSDIATDMKAANCVKFIAFRFCIATRWTTNSYESMNENAANFLFQSKIYIHFYSFGFVVRSMQKLKYSS